MEIVRAFKDFDDVCDARHYLLGGLSFGAVYGDRADVLVDSAARALADVKALSGEFDSVQSDVLRQIGVYDCYHSLEINELLVSLFVDLFSLHFEVFLVEAKLDSNCVT